MATAERTAASGSMATEMAPLMAASREWGLTHSANPAALAHPRAVAAAAAAKLHAARPTAAPQQQSGTPVLTLPAAVTPLCSAARYLTTSAGQDVQKVAYVREAELLQTRTLAVT